MKKTAAAIGRNANQFIGKTVKFPDYHGRPVTGTLRGASYTPGAAHAVLDVPGRSCGVFADTKVEVR